MAKPIHASLARRLGRNIGDRRRATGLTQEQLAEYLEIDTLTVSRYETGNILLPLTVVDVVVRLLNTTIADLLGEAPVQPVGFCRINRPSQGWRYAGGLKFNGWDGWHSPKSVDK
jgi:transcriptional regulator with XRE-family HTH domain